MDLVRAARLVVDTGLHGKGWSREQTMAWLRDNVGSSEAGARRSTERYMAWPGQALSYKIGALKIRELRQRAERELGDAFSLAGFHEAVLAEGPLPMSLLEQRINDWIRQELGRKNRLAAKMPWSVAIKAPISLRSSCRGLLAVTPLDRSQWFKRSKIGSQR